MPEETHCRQFVVPTFNFICFAFFIASASSSFAIDTATDTTFSIFGCSGANCSSPYNSCDARKQTQVANAVFIILACVSMAIATAAAVARFFEREFFEKNGPESLVYFSTKTCLGLAALFSVVAFSLGFALFASSFCGVKFSDSQSFKIGASAPCGLVGFVFALICMCCEFLFEVLAETKHYC